MTHVVVIGGGFAGVAAVRELLKHKNIQITLIDSHPYQLFYPSLYEVATSEEPKNNVALPFSRIFPKRVDVVIGTVERINAEKQTVVYSSNKERSSGDGSSSHIHSNNIDYDYLILATGSIPAFYHIPGLKEHALVLKSLEDAMKIRKAISDLCCEDGKCNKKVQVIIGGGGFSGTELATELLTYRDRLARQHHLDPNCLEITIIQGSDRLLKELDPHVGAIAEKRLASPHVHFAFGGHISEVTKTHVKTDNNKEYPYDILIWTGGVEANSLGVASGLAANHRGQVLVNNGLQAVDNPHIFAAGDIAGYLDEKTKRPVPTVAEVAEDQGKTAAKNIVQLLSKKLLLPYHFTHLGYVVPLKGKYAAAELMGGLHFDGFSGWVLQQLVFLRYLLGVLPFVTALRVWGRFEEDLKQ